MVITGLVLLHLMGEADAATPMVLGTVPTTQSDQPHMCQ